VFSLNEIEQEILNESDLGFNQKSKQLYIKSIDRLRLSATKS